jgi:hypothetical protein
METETSTQAGAVTTAPALAWVQPDRFTTWCTHCGAYTEADSTTDTRWCSVCGERRDK